MTRRSTNAERLADLTAAVERLADYVQLLTSAVDELITELQWRNNQRAARGCSPALHVTSMPVDPTASDWQINRVGTTDMPATPAEKNRSLFE